MFDYSNLSLMYDNNHRGMIQVLWNNLRTTAGMTSCNMSNERAESSPSLGMGDDLALDICQGIFFERKY